MYQHLWQQLLVQFGPPFYWIACKSASSVIRREVTDTWDSGLRFRPTAALPWLAVFAAVAHSLQSISKAI